MSKECITLTIKCDNREEMMKMKESIHNQLAGVNEDYKGTNIILNGSDDCHCCNPNTPEAEEEKTKNNVYVHIFPEAKPFDLEIDVTK